MRFSAASRSRVLGTVLIALTAIVFVLRTTIAKAVCAADRPVASFTIHLQRSTFPETLSIGDEPRRLSATTIWPCEGRQSTSLERHDPPPTPAAAEKPLAPIAEHSAIPPYESSRIAPRCVPAR